ncbi:competence type IV pilus major pilin ComGC [Planctomycetota bacterium]
MVKRKGFTLIELMVVVLILGALAAVAIPRLTQSADTAKTNACNTNVDIINTQMELYYMDNGSYPTLVNLFADSNYFPDGTPTCPYGTAYTLTDDRVTEHGH